MSIPAPRSLGVEFQKTLKKDFRHLYVVIKRKCKYLYISLLSVYHILLYRLLLIQNVFIHFDLLRYWILRYLLLVHDYNIREIFLTNLMFIGPGVWAGRWWSIWISQDSLLLKNYIIEDLLPIVPSNNFKWASLLHHFIILCKSNK